MSESGLIVVGSGPGGISAAETFRQHDRELPVRILTADSELPYQRPPLSKDYLRGDTEDVSLHPLAWYMDNSIDLRLATEVNTIDPAGHTVSAGGVVYPYTSLVLACGAAPVPLPVSGGHHALHLRSLTDAAELRRRARDARSAVVVGAGFIGCEVAASLALSGISVTLVAPEDVPQKRRLGRAAGERLLSLVASVGVRYVGGVSVRQFDEGVVHLDNGVSIDCELIVAATGVSPRGEIAENAGADVRDGRIVVGSDMRSSVADVYAVGDVALAFNDAVGRHIVVEHWQDADDQGEIAGSNAAGLSPIWRSVPGFWSTIGDATLKYHAWGDGFEHDRLVQGSGDAFTVWYESAGACVGVLTHDADHDYDHGESLITDGRPSPQS